ncbi:hypothetical protein [Chamaesiphon sp. VAR_48_metabat_135_sub]|uniref:hypothetical protein n=1 Tax=Chamaesiphon sp. VAR_48_metabat_135_sub TaxID=2964699 RepID=UPI00286CB1A9|nr:hypothetical protein [Chamaesiphon sp. VAR_48_metabat_135_sub]
MIHTRDILALRRYMLIGQLISILVLLFGILSVCLFINPSLIGIVSKQTNSYRDESIWLIVGIVFILFGVFFVVVFGKWSRRLLWIFQNIRPVQMNLSIKIRKGMDSNDYYAILSVDSTTEKNWRVSLYSPSWNARELQDQIISSKVYFDPKSQCPAVIETTQGLLWAMAGRSAIRI